MKWEYKWYDTNDKFILDQIILTYSKIIKNTLKLITNYKQILETSKYMETFSEPANISEKPPTTK